MSLELLEVVDSAVKIGLGAAIAGITTYITTKANHDNEKRKELRSHKIKTIEMISEKCEQFVNSYTGFRARLDGILSMRTTDEEYQLSDPAMKGLKEYDMPLFDATGSVRTAKARLLLMGEEGANDALSDLLKMTADMRNPIMLERKAPSKEVNEKTATAMTEAIKRFQSELSKVYKEIQ